VSIEGEALVSRGSGARAGCACPERNVASLEVRQGGSTGRGVVGGLVGLSAGFLGTILVCVTVDDVCHASMRSGLARALGTALGAAAGAAFLNGAACPSGTVEACPCPWRLGRRAPAAVGLSVFVLSGRIQAGGARRS